MAKIDYNLKAFKKKTSVVNPAHIEITVEDNAYQPRRFYSKWSGSTRQLAEYLSKGNEKTPPRPFMLYEKREMDKGETRKHLAEFLKMYCTECKEDGIHIKWDLMANNCEIVARNLLMNNALGLIPLSDSTLELRGKFGVTGDTPLYAHGQLANSIIAQVVYEYYS